MSAKTKTTALLLSATSDHPHTHSAFLVAGVSEQHLKAPYYRRCTLIDVLSQALVALTIERGEQALSASRKTNPNHRF